VPTSKQTLYNVYRNYHYFLAVFDNTELKSNLDIKKAINSFKRLIFMMLIVGNIVRWNWID